MAMSAENDGPVASFHMIDHVGRGIQVSVYCPVCGDEWGDSWVRNDASLQYFESMLVTRPALDPEPRYRTAWAVICRNCTLADLHRKLK